jgi:predicted nuclease of predicted toxin-antitoxin system
LRFLVDAQLPPALCSWLKQHGHEAEHVFEANLTASDDSEIWAHAVRSNVVLITKDEDFLAIRLTGQVGTPVVWLRIGNATNRALLVWLAPRFGGVLSSLAGGELVVEVR